jgi:hypothetical protein
VTAADLAPILAGLGGVSGVGAAVRWWLDRSERIRREDLAREDARAEASVARGQATGAALTATEDRITNRLEHVERQCAEALRILTEIRAIVSPATSEHRAGGS